MPDSRSLDPHLDALLVARYLDGTCDLEDRALVEDHLSACASCRVELGALAGLVRNPGRRRLPGFVPALAAAAALLLVVWGAQPRNQAPSRTRDSAITATLAPTPLEPVGGVAAVNALRWHSVPGAERYRLILFSADGQPLWQVTAPDTVAVLPDSVDLVPRATYYWQVKAETTYGRWVESELVEFTVAPGTTDR